MPKKLPHLVAFILGLSVFYGTSSFAQEPFYKDKMIRVIVATAAGGGYDLYTRTMARHLRKHIPRRANDYP
jgi:tripartite-type tricarboxylate transporter receptor subunit TctC